MSTTDTLVISPLERVLLGGSVINGEFAADHAVFLETFFDGWPLPALLGLARTNFAVYCVVKWYLSKRWDVKAFVKIWFRFPDRILRLLDEKTSVICGDNVLRYFHGCVDMEEDLDICTTMERIVPIVEELAHQGYTFCVSRTGLRGDFQHELRTAIRLHAHSLPARRTEKSFDGRHHRAHRFLFKKVLPCPRNPDTIAERFIVVRLIHCLPHKHILSQHSTMLMNYITSQYAVSIFAHSTLISMRSFVVSGTRVAHYPRFPSRGFYTISTMEEWSGRLTYEIVPGPPLNKRHFKEFTLGYRYIGDRNCLIHCVNDPAPFQDCVEVEGPKFEVADFSCEGTKPYSYASVGDPSPMSSPTEINRDPMT